MKNKKNKKGFTLIELIVVIAILAIIAALAIPSFNGIKRDAALRVGESNARTVYTAGQAAEALGAVGATETNAKVKELLGDEFADGSYSYAAGSGTATDTATWNGTTGGYTVIATYTNTGADSATK